MRTNKGGLQDIRASADHIYKQTPTSRFREIIFGHELGHHLLYREEAIQAGGFQEFNLFDMRDNRIEYEANLLVAQLVLPDDEIKEFIYKGYDVHQIARAMQSDINLVAIKVA